RRGGSDAPKAQGRRGGKHEPAADSNRPAARRPSSVQSRVPMPYQWRSLPRCSLTPKNRLAICVLIRRGIAPRSRSDGPLAHASVVRDFAFFTPAFFSPGGTLMRRVFALSTFVVVVAMAAGLAVAQEETGEPAPEGTDPTGEFAEPAGEDAPPGSVSAPGTTATSAAPEQGMDAGSYAVRLRDLEQRINELKEQIFRSKARLSLLAETVLQ